MIEKIQKCGTHLAKEECSSSGQPQRRAMLILAAAPTLCIWRNAKRRGRTVGQTLNNMQGNQFGFQNRVRRLR